MTEDEMRDLFREMREEEIPADSLARVRMKVSERTQRGRWLGYWKIAALVVASACLVWVLSLRSTPAKVFSRPVPLLPAVARQTPALPIPISPAAVRKVVHRRKKPIPRVEPVRIAGGASVIRIETPDPDVVILLLGD